MQWPSATEPIDPVVDAVRPPVGHGGGHLLDQPRFDGGAVKTDDAGDAAHGQVNDSGDRGWLKEEKRSATSWVSLMGTPAASTHAWASSLPWSSFTPMRSLLFAPRWFNSQRSSSERVRQVAGPGA